VSQRYFSRTRHSPAANQTCIADGVVRRTKRPSPNQSLSAVERASNAVNAGGFDSFF
jgi:hypothetical protein